MKLSKLGKADDTYSFRLEKNKRFEKITFPQIKQTENKKPEKRLSNLKSISQSKTWKFLFFLCGRSLVDHLFSDHLRSAFLTCNAIFIFWQYCKMAPHVSTWRRLIQIASCFVALLSFQFDSFESVSFFQSIPQKKSKIKFRIAGFRTHDLPPPRSRELTL